MTEAIGLMPRASGGLVSAAVQRNRLLSMEGLSERAFTFAFSGLVYPQIWEDPVVDLKALALTPESRIIAIASGGCNVLSYLAASPAHITAVDLNPAHVALNRLKLAAVKHLPGHAEFHRFFGDANDKENLAVFDTRIRPHLDAETHDYWLAPNWRGHRHIDAFANNFYTYGLLGRFIGLGHLFARLLGIDPRIMMTARSFAEQAELYDTHISPLFDRKLVRAIVQRPASLFGLGIPPAQFKALAGGGSMADVLRKRLRRLACDFPLSENYFACQAFGRSYQPAAGGALPPYLEEANFATLQANIDRVEIKHASFTDVLAQSNAESLDRYVLLDAQDWMSDADLTSLWRQITRTARPGARVIFRTAAEPSLLPGRIPGTILARWDFRDRESAALTKQDRSAIYGAFHLYQLRA